VFFSIYRTEKYSSVFCSVYRTEKCSSAFCIFYRIEKCSFFIQVKLFQEAEGTESRAKYPREIFKIHYDTTSILSCYSPAITSTFLPLRPENAGSDKELKLKDRQRDKVMPWPSRPPTQGAVLD
jgi:hypothetical protein